MSSREWAAGGEQQRGVGRRGGGRRNPGGRAGGGPGGCATQFLNCGNSLFVHHRNFQPTFSGSPFPLLKSISSAFSLWKCTVRQQGVSSRGWAAAGRQRGRRAAHPGGRAGGGPGGCTTQFLNCCNSLSPIISSAPFPGVHFLY